MELKPGAAAKPEAGSGASDAPDTVPEEQLRYARVLQIGARAAIALMTLAFLSYWLGWPAPALPHQRLPELWSLPVDEYLAQSGLPAGWGWVPLIGHSDILNLAVMAMLAALNLPCLMALLPTYARSDRTYFALVVAEILVTVFAATGWISAGH